MGSKIIDKTSQMFRQAGKGLKNLDFNEPTS